MYNNLIFTSVYKTIITIKKSQNKHFCKQIMPIVIYYACVNFKINIKT